MKGMKATLGQRVRRFVRNGFIALSLAASITAGCGGSYQQPTPQQPIPLNQYGYVDERVVDMIDLIGQAQMPDWYSYGMSLYERDNIRIVTDKELSPYFNAFAWIPQEVIWFTEVCFERYDRIDRGEIMLHELVHCKTKLVSHTPYFGEVQREYRQYWDR